MSKKKIIRPALVGLSGEGVFAKEKFCFPQKSNAQAKRRFCEGHRLFVGHLSESRAEERVLCLVRVRLLGATRLRLMDAITGIMFDIRSGRCESSLRFRLVEAKENFKAAAAKLRKWQPVELAGGGEW